MGDACKALDLWETREGKLRFLRRLKRRSAGFTAATALGDRIYFGTDFSSRPNWIETLTGTRYPFPAPAYRCYVEAMEAVDERHLVAVSKNMLKAADQKVWSVFDTGSGKFLYCGRRPSLPAPPKPGTGPETRPGLSGCGREAPALHLLRNHILHSISTSLHGTAGV